MVGSKLWWRQLSLRNVVVVFVLVFDIDKIGAMGVLGVLFLGNHTVESRRVLLPIPRTVIGVTSCFNRKDLTPTVEGVLSQQAKQAAFFPQVVDVYSFSEGAKAGIVFGEYIPFLVDICYIILKMTTPLKIFQAPLASSFIH